MLNILIFCLHGPFFDQVMEYEYDPQMEVTYRRSLIKLVRKSIDDRFYPFLIIDQNNEQLGHFRDMVDHAEANQFQVYFVELNNDLQLCAQRNIHHRTLADIEQVNEVKETIKMIDNCNCRFINVGNSYHFDTNFLIYDHYFSQMLLRRCVEILFDFDFIFVLFCLSKRWKWMMLLQQRLKKMRLKRRRVR